MILSLIAAMTTSEQVIGKNNALPWHLPADLKHFKTITLGKSIVMGRKTFESIGKALPERHNIVVTQQIHFQAPGCTVVPSLESALEKTSMQEEVFIIGGATLYQAALPFVQRMYLTLIHASIPGNIHFPAWNKTQWTETDRKDFPADEKNIYPYSFLLLTRVPS